MTVPLPEEPAPVPARAPIAGARVTLVPLDPERHERRLYDALHDDGDPRLWAYLPYGPFERAAWGEWIRAAAASADPLFFAVERRDGAPLGFLSLLRIEPEHRVIEIGHIAFGSALQRTAEATEAVFLAARHVLDELGYRRFEWKCDARNARSRAAAERFGFTFEGIFRQHMIVKGRNRDTAWYAIVDADWPPLRAAFERWLDPGNFDAAGRQRARLKDLRL